MSDINSKSSEGTPNEEMLHRFIEPYNLYLEAVQKAWEDPEIQQRGSEAYQRYLHVVQDIWQPGTQQRAVDTWNSYMQVVVEALADGNIREQTEKAYYAYLQNLQKAWMEVDLSLLTPDLLATIGQNILTIAWIGAAARGTFPTGQVS